MPFVLVPALQEVGDIGSDTGIADTAEDLEQLLPDLFEEGELEFDLGKIDAFEVKKGWNSKVKTIILRLRGLLTGYRKAIGPTRRVRSQNAQQTFGTGCSSDLKEKFVGHCLPSFLHTDYSRSSSSPTARLRTF